LGGIGGGAGAHMYEESMGIKKSTVWLWIREGRLHAHKVGRKYYVSSEDLRRYIESGPSPVAKQSA